MFLLFKPVTVTVQEAAWFVTDEALQILGGMGYMRVSSFVMHKLLVLLQRSRSARNAECSNSTAFLSVCLSVRHIPLFCPEE